MPKKPTETVSDRFHGTDDDFRNAGMDPPEKPTKKPRTASPVQLASRAFQRLCDLQAQQAREVTRHVDRIGEINSAVLALEAEVDAMSPEVRRLFEGLRAAAEGAK